MLIKKTMTEINDLCEHLYFMNAGDFSNSKFIEDIVKLQKYFIETEKLENYFEKIPLFAYADLLLDKDNKNMGIYNIYFLNCKNKDEKLKLLIKDCRNLYKSKGNYNG